MLLREDGDAVICIGQASHAWISGQLARAWGNAHFPMPPPHEEVCLAAFQHDIGMAEWDLRPTLNRSTGLPHSFLEMPLELHIGLWSAAPAKLLAQSSYAALLVSMHGTALYGRRDLDALSAERADLVRRYLEAQRQLQAALRERLEIDADELARAQRLIWTWDSLSLALCLPWDPHTATRVPSAGEPIDVIMRGTGPGQVELRPWPFAAPELEVRCEGRRLTERFESEDEMRAALERATPVPLTFTLLPDRSSG